MKLIIGSLLIPLVLGWPGKKSETSPDTATSAEAAAETPDTPDDNYDAIVEVDLDSDGRPDLHKYTRQKGGETIPVRVESDLNRDGSIDVWTYYKGGVIAREEFDGDFDGKVDWRDLYKDGVRIRAEIDTDHNQSFDCVKRFKVGVDGVEQVTSIERDTLGNGMVDYWELHQDDGKVLIYRDIDFDGKMDIPNAPAE